MTGVLCPPCVLCQQGPTKKVPASKYVIFVGGAKACAFCPTCAAKIRIDGKLLSDVMVQLTPRRKRGAAMTKIG